MYFDVNIIKYLEYPRYYYDIAIIWPQSTFLISPTCPSPITHCFARVPFLLFPEKKPIIHAHMQFFLPEMISATFTYLSFEIKIFYFEIFRQPSLSSLLTQSNVLSVHSPFPVAALLLLLRLVVTPEPLSHSIRAGSLHHSESACKHDLLVLLR